MEKKCVPCTSSESRDPVKLSVIKTSRTKTSKKPTHEKPKNQKMDKQEKSTKKTKESGATCEEPRGFGTVIGLLTVGMHLFHLYCCINSNVLESVE